MNPTQVSAKRFLAVLVWPVLFSWVPLLTAQDQAGGAEVRAIQGSATYRTNGGPAHPLKTGLVLASGTILQTGPGSTVDLFLRPHIGLIRLKEKSTLGLDKVNALETGADTAVDVQLNLPDGEMYFDVNKLSKASRYEIKMPTGVAGIRGTRGSFCFRPQGARKPPVTLLEGKVVFVHVPAGGSMDSYTMSAPPAVYFSATDGIKEAPPALAGEAEHELESSKKEISRKPENPGPATLPPDPPKPPPNEPFLSPASGNPGRHSSSRSQPR
jgi:hypothetical protein